MAPELKFWTELVAVTERVAPGTESAASVIERIAAALAERTEGDACRWSDGPRPVAGAPEPAAGDPADLDPELRDAPADAVTAACAVWLTSRKVVGLTIWLLFVQRWSAEHQRQCVIVTPSGTELTRAAVEFVQATGSLWVVDTGQSLYDALSGLDVRLQDDGVVAVGTVNDAFASAGPDRWTLGVEAELTHSYDGEPIVGRFTQSLATASGLEPLAALSVVEPLELDWDLEVVTEYARQKSPGISRLLAAGPGVSGVITVVPQPVGVVERCLLGTVVETEALSADAIDRFVEQVLRAGAQVAVLSYRSCTESGRVRGRFSRPAVPAAIVVRRDRFPTLTDTEALRVGGDAARLTDTPARALVVSFDLAGAVLGEDPVPAQRAIEIMAQLEHHDAHVQAARSGDGAPWQAD